MIISVFDLFKIGIGPSSSHTVGPMKAAVQFLKYLGEDNLQKTTRVEIALFGSLAATGKGHDTDKAVVLGLSGELPESIDTKTIESKLQEVYNSGLISLAGIKKISFNPQNEIIFYPQKVLPYHSNALTFKAFLDDNSAVEKTYYSVGGGFVNDGAAVEDKNNNINVKYPFKTAQEILQHCDAQNISISQLMLKNEECFCSQDEIKNKLLEIWRVMEQSIESGCANKGVLRGGLNINRRAKALSDKLNSRLNENWLDWVNVWAIAVNEENAAGGRIVTAPTNGAAGIIPAVLKYAIKTVNAPTEKIIVNFLLTAAAIGILYKLNASISGAEVGCQGEIGVACSMAAGALAECMGGTVNQVENAAEIAMEHNLGLTCDPVNGLVQVPCIERNAMGANKAINAAKLALLSVESHYISLDRVIKTMKEIGLDMNTKYKETAMGGLALNKPEC